ncbi:Gfo/Idh/MocA family protein [Nocardia sp. NPDC050406]|uniref:Gfo/Idh/MocA family protein n=1 Tax=Nocardia sp. NPDC050406 TaxID=3364318 RepID=UPI0037A58784
MKIALLGTGFGRAHAAVFAARDDVEVIVFGRTPAALAELEATYGFPTTTDLDSLYADPSIDLIDICLPTALHPEHVLRGLAAGKHVLSELPLGLDMAAAARVVDAAAASDRQVFVDMYDRFSAANRILLDANASGTYGPLRELELDNHTARLWPGYDLGLDTILPDMLHGDIDLVIELLGRPAATSVAATAGPDAGSAVHALFSYPDAVARCSGSSLMPHPYGSHGGYRATFAEGVLEYAYRPGDTESIVVEHTAAGRRDIPATGPDNYTAMIEHVLACLRGEAENRITPASVMDALELTLDVHAQVSRRP